MNSFEYSPLLFTLNTQPVPKRNRAGLIDGIIDWDNFRYLTIQ